MNILLSFGVCNDIINTVKSYIDLHVKKLYAKKLYKIPDCSTRDTKKYNVSLKYQNDTIYVNIIERCGKRDSNTQIITIEDKHIKKIQIDKSYVAQNYITHDDKIFYNSKYIYRGPFVCSSSCMIMFIQIFDVEDAEYEDEVMLELDGFTVPETDDYEDDYEIVFDNMCIGKNVMYLVYYIKFVGFSSPFVASIDLAKKDTMSINYTYDEPFNVVALFDKLLYFEENIMISHCPHLHKTITELNLDEDDSIITYSVCVKDKNSVIILTDEGNIYHILVELKKC